MIEIRATVRCDADCEKHISFVGKAKINSTRIKYIALNRYGWQVGSRHLCFEHRSSPLDFHQFSPINGKCSRCDSYGDWGPQHHEDEVRMNAHDLTEDGFASWTND